MNKIKLSEIMKERERIWIECQDNWADGIERCSKEVIAVIKEDIKGFIEYLKNDCTKQEYLYITDWFDEIIQEIKSQELINTFKETMNNRFLVENQKYNIERDLSEAIEEFGKGEIH